MKLKLRTELFWDVNIEEIDVNLHRAAVIERIATRGKWEEFKAIIEFYGREEVKSVLVNTRHLDKKTLYYCSEIFNVPLSEFRCYRLAQLNPEHWSY